MGTRASLQRVYASLASAPYQTPVPEGLSAPAQQVLDEVRAGLANKQVDADGLLRLVDAAQADERLPIALAFSARAVIAAHPRVARFREAATFVELQAMHALSTRGDERRRLLASVDRHRGVLAFMLGRYEVALERFAGALAEERSVENVANVLATLAKLGEHREGARLLDSMLDHLPSALAGALRHQVATDGDLGVYTAMQR